jgi:DNA-binding NtrC family response regulator
VERILIVDDEAFIRENLERILTDDGYRTYSATGGDEAAALLQEEEIDLVLLDLNLGPESGIDLLERLKKIDPKVLVIIITGYATVESAVHALKLGAYDYIKKPFKADAIHLIVRLALETQSLRRDLRRLKRRGGSAPLSRSEMIGASAEINEVFHRCREVAQHDSATVLITGESGTGKELVARAIHTLSARSQQPFIEINCASLPYNLLESELFGHEQGAFTDAKSKKIGLLEEGNGGTVFLDEIGEMEINLQVKLLRVLEERKIRRLGGVRHIDIDIRIISSTNRDLKQAIHEKIFREDLYYRLNVFPITVPPLRERKDDIPRLMQHFLLHFNGEFNKKIQDVSKETLELLCHYHWPGNVRELRNVVERICIMHRGDTILPEHLPQEIWGQNHEIDSSLNLDLPPSGIDFDNVILDIERQLILKAMERTAGNVAKAARLLNMPRGTLRYKLEKYAIECDPSL